MVTLERTERITQLDGTHAVTLETLSISEFTRNPRPHRRGRTPVTSGTRCFARVPSPSSAATPLIQRNPVASSHLPHHVRELAASAQRCEGPRYVHRWSCRDGSCRRRSASNDPQCRFDGDRPGWVAFFTDHAPYASFDGCPISSRRCRCRTPYAASLTAASSSRPDPRAPPMVAMDARSHASVR